VAHKWTVKRGQKEHGPLSSEQLRNLARTGKLKPKDLVRRGETGDWKEASSVAGLFAEGREVGDASNQPPVADPVTTPAPSDSLGFVDWYKTKWMAQKPAVAQAALWLFYGVVWIPAWFLFSSNGSKAHKAWVGGAVAAFFLVGLIGSQFQRGQIRENVASAHELWDGGKQSEAVASYREILKRDVPFVEDKDRALLFERVITFDVENGNTESAMELLDRANVYGVTVTSQSPTTQALVARWRSEREQEKAEATRVAERESKSSNESTSGNKLSLTGWFKDDKLGDFLDNPDKYKGYEVTVDANYKGQGFDGWIENGKFATNVTCPFEIFETVNGNTMSAKLKVTIPTGMKRIPIRSFEKARIRFRCTEGSLTHGNIAVSVERP